MSTVTAKIQLRRGNASDYDANLVLLEGEIALILDTKHLVVGDGTTIFSQLNVDGKRLPYEPRLGFGTVGGDHNTAVPAFIARGASGQTAAVLDVQNNSGQSVMAVKSDGTPIVDVTCRTDTTALEVKANQTQSQNIVEVNNSSGASHLKVDSTGKTTIQSQNGASTVSLDVKAGDASPTNGILRILNSVGQDVIAFKHDEALFQRAALKVAGHVTVEDAADSTNKVVIEPQRTQIFQTDPNDPTASVVTATIANTSVFQSVNLSAPGSGVTQLLQKNQIESDHLYGRLRATASGNWAGTPDGASNTPGIGSTDTEKIVALSDTATIPTIEGSFIGQGLTLTKTNRVPSGAFACPSPPGPGGYNGNEDLIPYIGPNQYLGGSDPSNKFYCMQVPTGNWIARFVVRSVGNDSLDNTVARIYGGIFDTTGGPNNGGSWDDINTGCGPRQGNDNDGNQALYPYGGFIGLDDTPKPCGFVNQTIGKQLVVTATSTQFNALVLSASGSTPKNVIFATIEKPISNGADFTEWSLEIFRA